MPKNTTQCPWQGLEPEPLDVDFSALTIRPLLLWICMILCYNCCGEGRIIQKVFVNTQVLNDEETDEFAAYFRCEVVPKVLITSSDRSKVVCVDKNTKYQMLYCYFADSFCFLK